MSPTNQPASNPLLVPMPLEVMLANEAMLGSNIFWRWKHRYDNLTNDKFASSEPDAFDDSIENGPGVGLDMLGAILHWTLPRALRASQPGSSTAYPLVPNRWLVVRLCRDDAPDQAAVPRVATAWVVESDCPAEADDRASFFLVNEATVTQWEESADPRRSQAQPVPVKPLELAIGGSVPADADAGAYTVAIGRATALADWQEQDAKTMFLTAVAPGNLEFSAYVPFHENVFSFHDDLTDVPENATLSYQVTGWYSDNKQDVVNAGRLAGASSSAAVLAALGWQVAGQAPADDPGLFTASLYSGTALGLKWEQKGGAPTPDQLTSIQEGLKWEQKGGAPTPDQLPSVQQQQHSPIVMAVANTSVEAFTTLVAGQLSSSKQAATPNTPNYYQNPAQVIELLRAFHYDLLSLLNQANGDALLSERIRQEWFSAKAGGTRWTITADQAPGGAPPDAKAALTAAERTWLTDLNRVQQALDAALAELHHLQWDLHATWWKTGLQQAFSYLSDNLTGTSAAELAAGLDATNPNSLLGRVLAQLEKVQKLTAQLPQPKPAVGRNAQDAFLAGVAQFAAAKGLKTTQQLEEEIAAAKKLKTTQQLKKEVGLGAGPQTNPDGKAPTDPDENAPTGKLLKAVGLPRFWRPTNPTILLSGVEPAAATDPSRSLTVRHTGQLVQGVAVAGTILTGKGLAAIVPPLPATLQELPEGVSDLYHEFFLLDSANAPQVAAHTSLALAPVEQALRAPDPATTTSVLPALGLAPWTQQWNPLYLEWEVSYTDVPYEYLDEDGRWQNWAFDGTDYVLVDQFNPKADQLPAPTPQTLKGRSVLSAHTRFVFGERLQAFAQQYGTSDAALSGLYAAIEQVDAGWHFLSQELVNFNDLLIQRDARAFRKPTTEAFVHKGTTLTFEKVTGYPNTPSQPPYDTPLAGQGLVGAVPAVHMGGSSHFPFHHLRSGLAYLTRVILYDKFGRQLEVVKSGSGGPKDSNNFPLVVDQALVVNKKLKTQQALANIAAPFQLPPRLLQPARLDVLPVHYQTDKPMPALDQEINPVCGWLIANHLDQGLLLFAPDGASMGELRLGPAPTSTGRQVQWQPPLHNEAVASVAAVTARSPQLGAFVVAAEGRDETDFQALLGVIDSTLATTEPLGARADQHLSVLVGRALALVRMRVQFVLDGPALTSCDWLAPALATNPELPPFATSRFSIRFGSLATREDGVIGYFTGDDYAVFNSVAAPAADYVRKIAVDKARKAPLTAGTDKRPYVQEIGPLGQPGGNYLALPFDGHTSQFVTLLADPRAAIHATTGLVPVKAFTLPAPLVYPALARIELTFRVGPRLARRQPAPATGEVPPAFDEVMSYLPLSEKNGAWSWWEKTAAPDPAPATWQPFGLTAASLQATFGAGPVSVRDGYLQFVAKSEPAPKPAPEPEQ